jgi:two-component system CheB/CheR fusion protein
VEPEGAGYRIHKSVRDMVIFSEQDVLKDPPFSRLDLLSCRNLLIYFGAELQRKLMPLFYYALQPGGLLFLGTSEGVGDFMQLFATLDRKAKLYQRISPAGAAPRLSPSLYLPPLPRQTIVRGMAIAHLPSTGRPTVKPSLRELTEQALLNHLAVAAALVTHQGDILYLQGRSGPYLELRPGEPGISNVLKMARNGLRTELTHALQRVHTTQLSVQVPRLMVQTNGHRTPVDLTVLRVRAGSPPIDQGAAATDGVEPLYLVILEETRGQGGPLPVRAAQGGQGDQGEKDKVAIAAEGSSSSTLADAQARIQGLTEELRAKDEYIQSTHEELESSNEELKSSNEEMQSVNEELQSTNEEMETSKEELQSLNEELATVNNELHAKVQDLSRANNDMNNLLAGTGIATVFLDAQLRILRFTPTASALINLIDGDIGRQVAHIVSNLKGYTRLLVDAQSVLDTLLPVETQVQSLADRWFTLRMRPYRTLENVIEGVVVTFEDITGLKQTQDELNRMKELARLAVVVRDANDAITVQDLDGRTLAWNPGAVRLYGWTEAQALAMNIRTRIPPGNYEDSVGKLVQLSHAEVLAPYATQRLCSDGRTLDVWITSTALINEGGEMYAVATTERARRSPDA